MSVKLVAGDIAFVLHEDGSVSSHCPKGEELLELKSCHYKAMTTLTQEFMSAIQEHLCESCDKHHNEEPKIIRDILPESKAH